MKRILSILIVGLIVVVAPSCQTNSSSVEEPNVCSLNVYTDDGVGSRSAIPDVIPGYKLRYILEIYLQGEENCYKRMTQIEGRDENPEQFQFRLTTSQTYDFLVWVDYVDENDLNADLHYNTRGEKGLKRVVMKGDYLNNVAHRDAFFESFTSSVEHSEQVFPPITCKRPFGQLNVMTTDWNDAAMIAPMEPNMLNIAFKAQTAFNVLTKEPIEGDLDITYTTNQSFIGLPINGKQKLTCDYIFAPSGGRLVNPVIALFDRNGNPLLNTQHMLANLPIQRNYKTNVEGNLLTKSGSVNVTVDPKWTGEIPEPVN